jgi:hypothetical protein
MAGPAPSSETPVRRAARLAVGVSGTLVFIQFFPWPLSHIAPVFTALLLQDAAPMTLREGFRTVGFAALSIMLGFLLALVLSPYLGITVFVFCLIMFRLYLFMLCAGAHILAIIGVLAGIVLMPVMMRIIPEIALIAAAGLVLNLTIAFALARVAFLLIPPPSEQAKAHHAAMAMQDAVPVALSMVVVAGPLFAAFLMSGWTDILVLVYGTLIAMALGTAGGMTMGLGMVRANLVYGGLGMLFVYEVLVMAPFLPLMVVLIFTACFIFGGHIFSGRPTAGAWASGFTGFLLLLGGALASDSVVSGVKVLDRAHQILLATFYIAFAYAIVDLIRSFVRSDRRAPEPAEG